MSLKDLTKHIDDQEKAISELRPESISQTARSTYWSDFRDSLWGEGLESFQEEENVKRGIDPVEDIALPERHIVATLPVAPLPPWNMLIRHADTDADTRKFLVRSEYDEAEREAVSSSKAHAMFVVSGQPGIGLLPSLSPLFRNLIPDQESPSFWCGFSCAASRSGFPRCCRSTVPARSSSTKTASSSLQTLRTQHRIGAWAMTWIDGTNETAVFGPSLTWVRGSRNQPASSSPAHPSLSLTRCLLISDRSGTKRSIAVGSS